MDIRVKDVLRFLSKIGGADGSGCRLWTAGCNSAGYGTFSVGNREFRANRFIWRVVHGKWPPADLCVCHKCDTPRCVEPEHLWLGTAADNVADMVAKKSTGLTVW